MAGFVNSFSFMSTSKWIFIILSPDQVLPAVCRSRRLQVHQIVSIRSQRSWAAQFTASSKIHNQEFSRRFYPGTYRERTDTVQDLRVLVDISVDMK